MKKRAVLYGTTFRKLPDAAKQDLVTSAANLARLNGTWPTFPAAQFGQTEYRWLLRLRVAHQPDLYGPHPVDCRYRSALRR